MKEPNELTPVVIVLEFGSFNAGEHDEYNGASFVEISKIFEGCIIPWNDMVLMFF